MIVSNVWEQIFHDDVMFDVKNKYVNMKIKINLKFYQFKSVLIICTLKF